MAVTTAQGRRNSPPGFDGLGQDRAAELVTEARHDHTHKGVADVHEHSSAQATKAGRHQPSAGFESHDAGRATAPARVAYGPVDEPDRSGMSSSVDGGVVDNAIYVDGIRTANPATLDETYELLRERQGMAWMGLYRPTAEEIRSVPAEFGLHHLVVSILDQVVDEYAPVVAGWRTTSTKSRTSSSTTTRPSHAASTPSLVR
jgi:hypothetical protein